MADPETQELRTDQIEREAIERERARHAELQQEERTHARRADKAGYLREKLGERAEAEEESEKG